MAYRFLDTGFYRSKFVRSLPASLKLLYSFIITDCSAAGIWIVDLEVAALFIGCPIDEKVLERHFKAPHVIDLGNGRWFFPGFIQHQYPKGLSHDNRAHRGIIQTLFKYDLITEDLKLRPEYLDPHKDLTGSNHGAMVMVQDKEMVKDKVMDAKPQKKNPYLGDKPPSRERLIIPDKVIMPWDSDIFTRSWEVWKEYKFTAFKFRYKNTLSEQAALNHLVNVSGGDEAEAIEIIRTSMAQGWKGLFSRDDQSKQNGNGKQKTGPGPSENYRADVARRSRGGGEDDLSHTDTG